MNVRPLLLLAPLVLTAACARPPEPLTENEARELYATMRDASLRYSLALLQLLPDGGAEAAARASAELDLAEAAFADLQCRLEDRRPFCSGAPLDAVSHSLRTMWVELKELRLHARAAIDAPTQAEMFFHFHEAGEPIELLAEAEARVLALLGPGPD